MELCCFAATNSSDLDFASGGKVLDGIADTADFENLFARQMEGFSSVSGAELQRKNAHADEVGAVDALIAFGDNTADSEKLGAFCGPIARGAGAVFFACKNHQRNFCGDVLY